MSNIEYGRCRWCGRDYIAGNGEWKALCSKKCKTEFYKEYPNQAEADHEQSEWDEAKEKRKYNWHLFSLVMFVLFFIYLMFFYVP